MLVADSEPLFRLGALTALAEAGIAAEGLAGPATASSAAAGDQLLDAILARHRRRTRRTGTGREPPGAVDLRAAAERPEGARPVVQPGPVGPAASVPGTPACVLLDAALATGLHGVDTVDALATAAPDIGVVVVISRQATPGLVEVLEAGARALLHRQCSPEELVTAVRSALDGTNWVSAPLAGPVRAELLVESTERSVRLTARETEVLRGLARGRANAAIAASLGISEHTVRNHVHSVLRKLAVANRTDAVATAVRRGLVDLSQ